MRPLLLLLQRRMHMHMHMRKRPVMATTRHAIIVGRAASRYRARKAAGGVRNCAAHSRLVRPRRLPRCVLGCEQAVEGAQGSCGARPGERTLPWLL